MSKGLAQTFSINLGEVVFTDHALHQLEKGYHIRGWKFYGKETAEKLLARAQEDKTLDQAARVRRLIDHNFEQCQYFMNNGWRFIIAERGNKLVVITIERNTR